MHFAQSTVCRAPLLHPPAGRSPGLITVERFFGVVEHKKLSLCYAVFSERSEKHETNKACKQNTTTLYQGGRDHEYGYSHCWRWVWHIDFVDLLFVVLPKGISCINFGVSHLWCQYDYRVRYLKHLSRSSRRYGKESFAGD